MHVCEYAMCAHMQVCVYMYVCMYVCVHVGMCVCAHVCVHVGMCVQAKLTNITLQFINPSGKPSNLSDHIRTDIQCLSSPDQ